jgi:hypothetical protein
MHQLYSDFEFRQLLAAGPAAIHGRTKNVKRVKQLKRYFLFVTVAFN